MYLTKIRRPTCLRLFPRPIQVAQFSSDNQKSSDDDQGTKASKKSKPKDDQTAKDTSKAKESAADRLNRLLTSMKSTDDNISLKSKSVKIPQAGARKQKLAREKAEKQSSDAEQKPDSIVQAAKDVADLVGDKTRQTEAELLSKLLNPSDGKEVKPSSDEGSCQSLSELIVGMKIDRKRDERPMPTRSDIVRKAIASKRAQQQQKPEYNQEKHSSTRPRRPRKPLQPVPFSGRVQLYGERLGIFNEPEKLVKHPDILETWSHLYKRELRLSVAHPPRNYYEKMIKWTEQGQVWAFPIDNEQGMDEEAKVDFTEHIFLERHLEGWCPNKGPIRHFMELVCVGLSKNPYLKASEKKEHILWYRDYFEKKKDLLKQVIVEKSESGAKSATKSLES